MSLFEKVAKRFTLFLGGVLQFLGIFTIIVVIIKWETLNIIYKI